MASSTRSERESTFRQLGRNGHRLRIKRAGGKVTRCDFGSVAVIHVLDVRFGVARAGVPASNTFREWMALALRKRRTAVSVVLRVVDDIEAGQLNQQFRGRDYATNVLSFPDNLINPINGTRFIGDIAICAPVVTREAMAQGKPVRAHFAHMTIHGVLHLLGQDHILEADALKMETAERQLLATLGFADPYA